MPIDNLQEPFKLPDNPPKDIVLSDGFKQEIIIKNHFSAFIVYGPIMLAIGIPGLYFLITQTESFDFEVIFGLLIFLFLIGYGSFALYQEIRNQMIGVTITADNDFLRIKFSNMDQPIEVQRGLDIDLVVDGVELYRNSAPTHRIITRLAHDGEIFANFGALTQSQYLWLKELFKSYFTLTIVYENKYLEEIQL